MPSPLESTLLTTRFQEGLALAMRAHARDVRKGTSIAYLAHLLGVCALILADGGDEDEAIAGLLHDTSWRIIPTPSAARSSRSYSAVGSCVWSRVAPTLRPTTGVGRSSAWGERKRRYLDHLRHARPDELRVSLADKVDNARAILTDYRAMGNALWARFSVGEEAGLRVYGALVDAFRGASPPGRLLGQLEAQVTNSGH